MSNDNHNDLPRNVEPELLTAYALGQLEVKELARVEALLDAGGAAAEREIAAVRAAAAVVGEARAAEPMPSLANGLRQRIELELAGESVQCPKSKIKSQNAGPSAEPVTIAEPKKRGWRRLVVELSVIGGICCVLFALLLPASQVARESSRRARAASELRQLELEAQPNDQVAVQRAIASEVDHLSTAPAAASTSSRFDPLRGEQRYRVAEEEIVPEIAKLAGPVEGSLVHPGRTQRSVHENSGESKNIAQNFYATPGTDAKLPLSLNNGGMDIALSKRTAEDPFGQVTSDTYADPYRPSDEQVARLKSKRLAQLGAVKDDENELQALTELRAQDGNSARQWPALSKSRREFREAPGNEQYAPIIENRFLSPLAAPLSTFSIDVDTASYANVRRFLNEGRLPPANSVRIEELVNYFRYDYPQPAEGRPFSVNMEMAECPWREGHLLLRIGLKGKDVHRSERPASNLVFLLDVSGSMADQNKLPLLKTAMKLLVGELGENDRVSIVTYAGEAGLKLAPTRGHEQAKINRVIDGLSAGGSTNGSAGIELAYEQATAGFIQGGTNRVILCTDGDLNVGITSDEALVKLIKKKAAAGVFLTVLGFGEGNLKDAKMERLADNGNGMYAYIDSVREAKKVLVEQLTGSTITIAKDVKIQIEFNPREIAAYRLLGYENRVMAAQDFNNDKKDAGEIGAGHTVTALYELVPAGAGTEDAPRPAAVDPLKYQPGANLLPEKRVGDSTRGALGPGLVPAKEAETSGELLTLKLRYKEPDGQTSKLVEYPLSGSGHSFHSASADFQFAAAVASFGMILRGSEHRGSANLASVAEIASAALGKDEGGYRAELVDLVRKAQTLGAR